MKVGLGGSHGIQDVGRRAVRGLFCRSRVRGRTIKIGYIDPLSGGGAVDRRNRTEDFQYLAEEINAAGGLNGKKVEIVGLDNKTNPQESLIQAQKAADQGVRIITQGNGSSVGAALDGLGVEIQRPQSRQGDPLFQLCGGRSHPHQRQMLVLAFPLGRQLRHQDGRADDVHEDPAEHQEGISHQSGLFLRSIGAQTGARHAEGEAAGYRDRRRRIASAAQGHRFLALHRQDQGVGADSVITGNWGQDIALLLKAAADAGLQANWYTYYAGGAGGPTAIKQTGLSHRVFAITEGVPNAASPEAQALRGHVPRQGGRDAVLSARGQRNADAGEGGGGGQIDRRQSHGRRSSKG